MPGGQFQIQPSPDLSRDDSDDSAPVERPAIRCHLRVIAISPFKLHIFCYQSDHRFGDLCRCRSDPQRKIITDMNSVGLITNNGRKKPGYNAFKQLNFSLKK